MTNEASVARRHRRRTTRPPMPTWPCRSSAPTLSVRPMSPPPSRSGTTIRASPTRSCAWSRRSSRAATSPASPRRVNAVEAWLGSLPGHVYANVRQPPVSTLNLAHMIPLSAVWAGPERDEHLGAPPLALWQDRRLDPVPVFASCRRRRPHAGRRPDRRRQVACCWR